MSGTCKLEGTSYFEYEKIILISNNMYLEDKHRQHFGSIDFKETQFDNMFDGSGLRTMMSKCILASLLE